ncbi:MAG TPA: GldG family protein [Opitutaceae bacterium]
MASFESFRAARWIRTLNLVLQALLFLTLFGGLNYLSLHYAWRFDLTEHRRHSLSPETLSYLETLKQPVKIYVTFGANSEEAEIAQAFRDVSGLLREYVYATETKHDPATGFDGRITVQYLDVYQQLREAQQLGITSERTLLVTSGEQRRVVGLDELYQVTKGRKEAFQGERALTAAILDASSLERKKIYFLVGHGEMSPQDVDGVRGLSTLSDELRARNFDVGLVDLNQNRRVPEDADLLIACEPQGRYEPYVVELLRQYLANGAGRLILLLSPGFPHGLDPLLFDWGIRAGDDVQVVDNTIENVTASGDLRVYGFAQDHPVTRTLVNYGAPLTLGPTRIVTQDPGRSLDSSLKVTVLAATAPSAWGETNYRTGRAEYNPGVDIKGRPDIEPKDVLGLITASERVIPPKDLPFSVRGGRLVVFGNTDLISNNRIGNFGNQSIMLNAVNWCLDRDTQLNIPARPIERFQLTLSQQDLSRLRYSLLLALPGAAALLGLLVYWTRRT